MRAITQLTRRAKKRLRSFPSDPALLVTLKEVIVVDFRGFNADRGIAWPARSRSRKPSLTAVPCSRPFPSSRRSQGKDTQILDVATRSSYHTARITQNLRDFVSNPRDLDDRGVLLIVASVRLIFIIEATFNAVCGRAQAPCVVPAMAIYTFALLVLALLMARWRRAVGGLGSFAQFGFPSPRRLRRADAPLPASCQRARRGAWRAWPCGALPALELLRTLSGVRGSPLAMNLITARSRSLMLMLASVFFVWVLILLGVELTHVSSEDRSGTPDGCQRRARRASGECYRCSCVWLAGDTPLLAISTTTRSPPWRPRRSCDVSGTAARRREHGAGIRPGPPADRITGAASSRGDLTQPVAISADGTTRSSRSLQPLFDRMDAERRSLSARRSPTCAKARTAPLRVDSRREGRPGDSGVQANAFHFYPAARRGSGLAGGPADGQSVWLLTPVRGRRGKR